MDKLSKHVKHLARWHEDEEYVRQMTQELNPLHAELLMHIHHYELKLLFAITRQVIIVQCLINHLYRPGEVNKILANALLDGLVLIVAFDRIYLKMIGDHVALLGDRDPMPKEPFLILLEFLFAL